MGFPDKRRHTYRRKSREFSIEQSSVGACFVRPTTYSLHSFIILVIGILNLRGGGGGGGGGEEGGEIKC